MNKDLSHYWEVDHDTIKVVRNRLCPPEGDPATSQIAFVAEAPGSSEISHPDFLQRAPLIGRSGDLFNRILHGVGINRTECYITNVIKERPLYNKVDQFIKFRRHSRTKQLIATRTPEYDHWEEIFLSEMKEFKGNLVVAMGNVSLYALTGKHGISNWRGSIIWSEKIGKKVLCSYHPAAALREWVLRFIISLDFYKITEEKKFPEIRATKRKYLTFPTYEECIIWLKHIKQNCKVVGFDIETPKNRGEVVCMSFATTPTFAICINFLQGGQTKFSLHEEMNIWKLTSDILQDPEIEIRGQNLAFDFSFLHNRYGIQINNIQDTMLAQRVGTPDYPMGLDFITSVHTDLPYYKEEGKKHVLATSLDAEKTYFEYNNKDSIVCYEAYPKQVEDLEVTNNIETYQHHVSLIPPCIYMGSRGLRTNGEGLREKSRQAAKEILGDVGLEMWDQGIDITGKELKKWMKANEDAEVGGLISDLWGLAGYPLDAWSPKELINYFYGVKGIPPYKKRGTQSPTVDESAMKRISRKGYDEAKIVLAIRKLAKLDSTYYKVKLKEGRLVCSYTPITGMGRLASRADIFDFGMNHQNQPKALNKYFLADEGFLIGNVDLSQADNRSVAYISQDQMMMEAFEEGRDVHSLTASLIFGIPPDEIKQMDKEEVKCDVGYGDQTHRYWGKKCNHALNFGMGYKLFAMQCEIQEKEAKELHLKYHRAYPSVQQRYHKMIKNQLDTRRELTNCFGRTYKFMGRWGEELWNQAYAFIPQSNTADIICRWGVVPFYYEEMFKEVELVRQVHDSINFQLPLKAGVERMEELLLDMKKSLERPLEWNGVEFTIPAEFSLGYNLANAEKVEGGQVELDFDKPLIPQIQQIRK